MKKVLKFSALAALVLGCGNGPAVPPAGSDADDEKVDAAIDVKVGEVLPAWQEGYLDIHSINGGRGEAFYYIFPDGTTMLCDAAGAPQDERYDYGDSQGVPSKPSADISSGSVIVNYIKHFAPAVAEGRLDYFLTSHYHGDHIGTWRSNYADFGWTPFDKDGNKVSKIDLNDGGFLLNGIAEVGLSIPIGKVIDRGDWASRPSADYFETGGQNRYKLYTNFIDYSARKHGTIREAMQIGSTEQIVLKHDSAAYPSFKVRAIAAGGDIWTGSGSAVNTTYMPSAEECTANHVAWAINENILSCVFLLQYGNFDFFSGGDIQYSGRSTYSWKDIEKPISKVVKKVEGMKACHHSTSNTNSDELLGVLRPDFYIATPWRDVQPNPATLKRVYDANPNVRIFSTNLAESNVSTLTAAGIDPAQFSQVGGHIVVRVLPEGRKYYIYALNDNNEQYIVTRILGPFTAY